MQRLRSILGVILLSIICTTAQDTAHAGPAKMLARPDIPTSIIQARGRPNDLKAMMIRIFDLIEAGRLDEAQALLEQAERLNSTTPGRVEERSFLLAGDRARILMRRGAFDQAETMLQQIIVAIEARHGLASDGTASIYATLGELYMREARWSEAEKFLTRAVEVSELEAGKSHPATADKLNSLATFYVRIGKYDKAERILQRTVKIYEKLGANGKDGVAATTLNLGTIYQYTGRANDALAYFKRAFELNTQVYGPDHPNTILSINNAGVLLGQLGRYDEALPLMEHSLVATLKRYGEESPQAAHAANNVGWVELGLRHYDRARGYFQPALAIYFRQRDMQLRGAQSRGAAVDEREVSRTILGLVRAARAQSDADPALAAKLANEAFLAVQRVHRGVAAQAFALASARFAAGDGPLAQLIRRRQDAARRWLDIEKGFTAVLASPAQTRDPSVERQARTALDGLQKEMASIDSQISQSFPAYAELAEPQPLSVAEARRMLGKDESLVLFAPFGGSNGEDLFTFVIDADGVAWRSAGIGATELAAIVKTLRCGLDVGQWDREADRAFCTQRVRAPTRGDPLPFSADVAYKLFATLFGDLAPRLVGKTLFVVAPDPLASLPLQALLTAPAIDDGASRAGLQKAAWLARTSALVVLPAASNLRRKTPTETMRAATLPFIGFGDPKLRGSIECSSVVAPTTCPDSARVMQTAALVSRGFTSVAAGRRTASGLADLDAVRALCPLPDTALELRCVAQSLRAPPEAVHIGAEATLGAVRSTNLARYRVVHFATHGLLAGEVGGPDAGAEPALVLTPPEAPQTNDDGLLRASEIATLKLDADWVVLSACNTAAGAQLGGEAMSGLASAFFYAGARTLLASHWPVRSDAAVLLTTRAFELLARNPGEGKAEAMRRAMVSLIDDSSLSYAHPSVWAPFVVAGDGGRATR